MEQGEVRPSPTPLHFHFLLYFEVSFAPIILPFLLQNKAMNSIVSNLKIYCTYFHFFENKLFHCKLVLNFYLFLSFAKLTICCNII